MLWDTPNNTQLLTCYFQNTERTQLKKRKKKIWILLHLCLSGQYLHHDTLSEFSVPWKQIPKKLIMPQLLHSSLANQFPWWLWGEDAIPPFVLHYVACIHIKGMLPILLHFLNTPPKVSQYAQETGHMQSGRASSIITRNWKDLQVCIQARFIYISCRISQVSAWEFWLEIWDV